VWLGITAEDQLRFDQRWPVLQKIPAVMKFISYEPAIGPLRLPKQGPYPDWLISGGESGGGARSLSTQEVSGLSSIVLALFMDASVQVISTRHFGTSMPSRGRPPHRSVDYPSDGPASVVVGRAVSTPLFCEEHGAAKSSGPGAHRSEQSVLGDVLERIWL
jgi:hypothetical protein